MRRYRYTSLLVLLTLVYVVGFSPRSQASAPAGPASPADFALRLPWSMTDEAWYLLAGPHRSQLASPVWSALDFAPVSGWCAAGEERAWPVLAARDGIVEDVRCDSVRLSHNDGLSTLYSHLNRVQVTPGARVTTGAVLGYLTCEASSTCASDRSALRPHLHFEIAANLTPVPISGTILSGWKIAAGPTEGAGQMTQGTRLIQPGATLHSDNSSDTDDARVLALGQTLRGQIAPGGDQDLYYLDASAGQALRLEMTRLSGALDPYVILRRPDGSYLHYDDDTGGDQNARLLYRLPQSGRYEIIARAYSADQAGDYTLLAADALDGDDSDDRRWLVHDQPLTGTIDTPADEDWYYFFGVEGQAVSLRMDRSGERLDSILELYDARGNLVAHNDDGGGTGTGNAWLVTQLQQTMMYRVKARSYRHLSSGGYTVKLRIAPAPNLALSKPTWASAAEDVTTSPLRAVDGRLDTRWSVLDPSPQWFYVDLEAEQSFDTVTLRWAASYAQTYDLYAWTGQQWERVFGTEQGRGGAEVVHFRPVTARYVLLHLQASGTQQGYSLWEVEVSDSSLIVTPIVPPDDNKPGDTVAPSAPLPLPEQVAGKEVLALYLGNGPTGQEVAPLPHSGGGGIVDVLPGEQGHPLAFIESVRPAEDRLLGDTDVIEFRGRAGDNDVAGDYPSIRAYEWRSSLNGWLSDQPAFTLPATALLSGAHLIQFRAQDNEGVWSPWVSVSVRVLHTYRSFLPHIVSRPPR